jgi:hypothetical protein
MGEGTSWGVGAIDNWVCNNHSKYSIQMFDGFRTIQVHLIFKTGHGRFSKIQDKNE